MIPMVSLRVGHAALSHNMQHHVDRRRFATWGKIM